MSDVLPFGSVTACAKCGVRFTPSLEWFKGYMVKYVSVPMVVYDPRNGIPIAPLGPLDYLRYSCLTCGYTWQTACADAAPQPVATDVHQADVRPETVYTPATTSYNKACDCPLCVGRGR